MRKFIHLSLAVAFISLMSSCAKSYYELNPAKIMYAASTKFEDILLEYRYDVLSEKGNTKNSKKEAKHNVKLIAVRITNNTKAVISIGKNAAFYSGNSMIYPMDAMSLQNNLKQSVPSHLWYLLLSPVTLSINGSKDFPIGLIVGPAIAGGNMLVASNANKNLYTELLKYDLL